MRFDATNFIIIKNDRYLRGIIKAIVTKQLHLGLSKDISHRNKLRQREGLISLTNDMMRQEAIVQNRTLVF
jgi:hypothetical protein